MKEDILKIINHYGVKHQLKYFQSEVFELNEAILEKENKQMKEDITTMNKEIERLNKILEDIDTYIHLWKIDDIGEKTMLILNDILLIKNGMSNEVIRLKGSDKE